MTTLPYQPLSKASCQAYWGQRPSWDELQAELENAPNTLLLLRVLSAEFLWHNTQSAMDVCECVSILAGDV